MSSASGGDRRTCRRFDGTRGGTYRESLLLRARWALGGLSPTPRGGGFREFHNMR